MAVAKRRHRWGGLLCLPFWAEAAGSGPSLLPDPELAKALAQLAGPSVRFGETLLLGLSINGVPQSQTLRAVRVREGLAVPQQLWDELHLKLPALAPRLIDGEIHIVLSRGGDGASWQIDEATQTLLIEAPASAFKGQTMGLERQAPRITLPPQLGFFANYDLQWQRRLSAPGRGGDSSVDALLELGALSGLGDLNSQHLYRSDGRLLRLDTRWTLDQPERMTRLRIGDSIGQPGTWGRAMRFGGLQWGTDFSLRPGFLSFPLPTLRGEAALPSTVDVYVNNSQRLQGRLQPGAFDISDLPIVTGQGEIRTVVRDLLGREQVVVQPYYVSPELLKPGLHAWSVELGRLREDYGLRSDHYGNALLSLNDRVGISEQFTGELRAELLARQQTAGAAGIWLWPALGTGSLALGLSRSRERGRGWLLTGGFDRQGRDWSGSIELRRASAGFAQLGQAVIESGGVAREARWSVASAIGSSWGATTLGLSYLQQGGGGTNEARPRLLSLNLGRMLGGWGYLSLLGLRDLAPGGGNSLALNWSFALGERSGGSVGLVRNSGAGQPERPQLQAQFQQNPPMGEGLAYQLLAETGEPGRAVAQAYWQGNKATLNAGAASNGRYKDLRAGASGGLAWLDGAAYLSRRIDGGFAVVQVGDYADVGVWHDNQPVARTDASGRAFIGSLRGYQSNRVGINAADLPFDAELEALEVKLTPAARSAALISFPVLRSRAASFRLLDARGQPIPPGSELLVPGPDPARPRSFAVGLEGRAFASGLAEGSQLLQVRWPDGACSVKLVLPPAPADLPELGPLTCR